MPHLLPVAPFSISRSLRINVPADRIHALINDLRAWQQWSPWEGLDPAMQRTYSGADTGVGSRYAWKGNKQAGEGSMEIVGSTPERIDVDLNFTKPWKAHNQVSLSLAPTGAGTEVTWTMTGENKGMAAIFAKLFNMDKMLGKDFDKGLAQLKTVAEA